MPASTLKVRSLDNAAEPAPDAHFTTVPMDFGSWYGPWDAMVLAAYDEEEIEVDQGLQSIDAGQTADIRGLTLISPHLAAQSFGSLIASVRIWGKAQLGPGVMLVKPVVAVGRWRGADLLGSIYVDDLAGVTFGTSYAAQVVAADCGAVSFAVGDRLVIDVWMRAENTAGVNVHSRWGFLKWGSAAFDMRVDLNETLLLMSEIPPIAGTVFAAEVTCQGGSGESAGSIGTASPEAEDGADAQAVSLGTGALEEEDGARTIR